MLLYFRSTVVALFVLLPSNLQPTILEAQIIDPPIQVCLSSEQASKLILRRLVKDRIYPSIPNKCLFTDLEEENPGYFLFAIRFNPDCCGVRSESTLMDRLVVIRHSQEIVWWDVADPEQFKSYSQFRKNQRR